MKMQCSLCNRYSHELFLITKQLGGIFENLYACPNCKAEHERELEMCRENYKRMTEAYYR